MGALTGYLQDAFARHCPPGWRCRREAPVLAPELERLLGYAPRADVLLERPDGGRLWIEFEISRADPVANHAKFATAHLFQPQPERDAFVAMVSPHIDQGRRNLAANSIHLMRRVGMAAFQTALLPGLPGAEIRRLNHLDSAALAREPLAAAEEVERALAVSEPVLAARERRIHLAGDVLEVLLNLRRWHADLDTGAGRAAWGRRTITYFVADPRSGHFAPAKFCAYVAVPPPGAPERAEMTAALYATLDGTDGRFDGHKARLHLTRRLAFAERRADQAPELAEAFARWHAAHRDAAGLRRDGPVFLLPPAWWR